MVSALDLESLRKRKCLQKEEGIGDSWSLSREWIDSRRKISWRGRETFFFYLVDMRSVKRGPRTFFPQHRGKGEVVSGTRYKSRFP